MSTLTDNDLKELKDLINSKFAQVDRQLEKLDPKIGKLSEDVNSLKVDLATLKEGQNSLNQRMTETEESLGKRLDNLEFANRGIFITVC